MVEKVERLRELSYFNSELYYKLGNYKINNSCKFVKICGQYLWIEERKI